MECGILAIKKISAKTFQIKLYSVFFNVPIKRVHEKETKRNLIVKEKEHSFISTSLQLQHWKNKDNDFLCQLSFLSFYLFWLMVCFFDFFYFPMHVTIMILIGETLGNFIITEVPFLLNFLVYYQNLSVL